MLEKEITEENEQVEEETVSTPSLSQQKADGRRKARSPAQIAATQKLVEKRRQMIEEKKGLPRRD